MDSECLGKTAKDHEPTIEQVFIAAEGHLDASCWGFDHVLVSSDAEKRCVVAKK